jgi:hypothetical protein
VSNKVSSKKMKNPLLLKHFELATRIYVCLFMLAYGGGKFVQFKGATQTIKPVSALTGQELMWAFFGYSQAMPIFIGVLQIIGGLLLLSNKTKLFGVAVLFPILTNIILMDLVYGVHLGALFNAIVYFSILLFILFFEREKLLKIVAIALENNQIGQETTRKEWLKTAFITGTLVVLLLFLSNLINNP